MWSRRCHLDQVLRRHSASRSLYLLKKTNRFEQFFLLNFWPLCNALHNVTITMQLHLSSFASSFCVSKPSNCQSLMFALIKEPQPFADQCDNATIDNGATSVNISGNNCGNISGRSSTKATIMNVCFLLTMWIVITIFEDFFSSWVYYIVCLNLNSVREKSKYASWDFVQKFSFQKLPLIVSILCLTWTLYQYLVLDKMYSVLII